MPKFGNSLPAWIEIRNICSAKHSQAQLEKVLDKGEASAIALALETDNAILIIDEKKGRKVAKDLKLKMKLFRVKITTIGLEM